MIRLLFLFIATNLIANDADMILRGLVSTVKKKSKATKDIIDSKKKGEVVIVFEEKSISNCRKVSSISSFKKDDFWRLTDPCVAYKKRLKQETIKVNANTVLLQINGPKCNPKDVTAIAYSCKTQ